MPEVKDCLFPQGPCPRGLCEPPSLQRGEPRREACRALPGLADGRTHATGSQPPRSAPVSHCAPSNGIAPPGDAAVKPAALRRPARRREAPALAGPQPYSGGNFAACRAPGFFSGRHALI